MLLSRYAPESQIYVDWLIDKNVAWGSQEPNRIFPLEAVIQYLKDTLELHAIQEVRRECHWSNQEREKAETEQ